LDWSDIEAMASSDRLGTAVVVCDWDAVEAAPADGGSPPRASPCDGVLHASSFVWDAVNEVDPAAEASIGPEACAVSPVRGPSGELATGRYSKPTLRLQPAHKLHRKLDRAVQELIEDIDSIVRKGVEDTARIAVVVAPALRHGPGTESGSGSSRQPAKVLIIPVDPADPAVNVSAVAEYINGYTSGGVSAITSSVAHSLTRIRGEAASAAERGLSSPADTASGASPARGGSLLHDRGEGAAAVAGDARRGTAWRPTAWARHRLLVARDTI